MMIVLAMAPFTGSPLTEPPLIASSPMAIEGVRKLSYEHDDHRVALRRVQGKAPLFFQSKMSCDVDGAPNAYHALNDDLALDVIGSAEGRRFGNLVSGPLEVPPSPDIIVYDGSRPYVQTSGEYAGFYVSSTSLYDSVRPAIDPTKYLDSRRIQYIVLPGGLCPEAKVGDLAAVYDPQSRKVVYAVFGDIGPSTESGEASLATLRRLGLAAVDGKSSPGEYRDDLFYVVFPNTASKLADSEPWPHEQRTIDRLARKEFEEWGGSNQVETILSQATNCGSVPDNEKHQWIYNELAIAKNRGWINTVDIGLPSRFGSNSTRLPCAPEIVLACRDALLGIQAEIEAAERGGDGTPSENMEFHLRKFAAIISNFPDAADEEGVSPAQMSVRADQLVSRLLTLQTR